MHPPKVNERSYIEFPEPSDITITQMIDGHTALIEDVNDLKESIDNLENIQLNPIRFIIITVGFIIITIAVIALIKSNNQ